MCDVTPRHEWTQCVEVAMSMISFSQIIKDNAYRFQPFIILCALNFYQELKEVCIIVNFLFGI